MEISDDSETSRASSEEVQLGVRKVEVISLTWTKASLICAYLGIFLMAFSTSLEGQTVLSLSVFATSSFNNHSSISIVYVVQGIVNAVIKPPMAKVADVFGRLEAFSIAVFLYVLGYIQMAGSQNVQTYAAAQIFYSAGSTGLQILQQIFIADTSDLLNRALFSNLPDVPFLVTVWAGPPIAQFLLRYSSWRWGYGIWTIILPLAFLPLASSLFINYRKAKRLGLVDRLPHKSVVTRSGLRRLWIDLDVMGLLLLSTALALILIPLNLSATTRAGWHNPSIVAMLVIGLLSAAAFPIWESSKRLAPAPFLSLRLLQSRTVLCGCALAFFYFMAFYLSVQPYFYSYLLIVHDLNPTVAGHITQTFSFSATISSILTSLIIKHTRRYKPVLLLGSVIYLLALILMLLYRRSSATILQLVLSQALLGLGGGMVNVPAQLGVQASATHQEVAAATAIFLTVLEIGGAVGAAISGNIWASQVMHKLLLYLPAAAKADAAAIFGSLDHAKSFATGTPERQAINRSYEETMHILLKFAVAIAIPVIPLASGMRGWRLDRIQQGSRGKVIGRMSQGEENGTDDGSRDPLATGCEDSEGEGSPRRSIER